MTLEHLLAILKDALPVVIIVLGAILAAGKVIAPEVAARNPHLGAIVDFWDTIVDTIYNLLTSKAGLAEDVATLSKSDALQSVVAAIHKIEGNPGAAGLINAVLATLPSADADEVRSILSDLPESKGALMSQVMAHVASIMPPGQLVQASTTGDLPKPPAA